MKKILTLLLVLMVGVGLTGCSNGQRGGNGELVLGENAFGVHVTVRNMTTEKVKFMVIPHADEFGYGGQAEIGDGIFGTDGLVPGRKKGDEAELDGSFTLYAHNESGPSAVITVKGTYKIDDLDNDFSTMHFYLYQDGQFIKCDRETVYK